MSVWLMPDVVAGEPATPWSESFTMVLKERERQFVIHHGVSYLVMQPGDIDDPAFLAGKEVMLAAKFERALDRTHALLYQLDRLDVTGRADLWSTRLDGDNLYLFGRMRSKASAARKAAALTLEVTGLAQAPSDSQTISERLKAVAPGDFAGRLAVAEWARESAGRQGNRDFWTNAAENIIAQVVVDAAAAAAEKKDGALVMQAMDWALGLARDPVLAAKAGSQAWIRETPGELADQVAKRMHQLDFALYKGQWRPRSEALAASYEDRYAEVAWKDADGYYKLGRWAEANLEVLPRARELAHRAYQAGFRADPNHNGIRRELGLELVQGSAGARQAVDSVFKDRDTNSIITGPEGWTRRAQAIDGEVTWEDPQSQSAYLSVALVRRDEVPASFEPLWTARVAQLKSRKGFTPVTEEATTFPNGQAKRLHYTYREGEYVRHGSLAVGWMPGALAALIVSAGFEETELAAVEKHLLGVLGRARLVKKDAPAVPGAPAAPAKPDTPDARKAPPATVPKPADPAAKAP